VTWLVRFLKSGNVPAGLVGMLILVGCVERALARLELGTMTLAQWEFRLARNAAVREAKGLDVLCFGDSLVKNGVAPSVIEKRSGLRGYNLALDGGQPSTSYYLLRRALASGARPSAILVDFFPKSLGFSPHVLVEPLPELLSYSDCLDLAWTYRDSVLFASLVLRKAAFSIRNRETIRSRVVLAIRGQPNTSDFDNHRLIRNWIYNRGALIVPSHADFLDFDVNGYKYNGKEFYCHPVNRLYIERFLRLATAHEIPVILLVPPILPIVQEKCEATGFEAKQTVFLRDIQAQFPGVTILDGRRADYDRMAFYEPIHLKRTGAYNYSMALAGLLREMRRGDRPLARWASLPRYRGLQDLECWGSMEDLYETTVALNRTENGARR